MLGDSRFDAIGARLCKVDFIGVSYGYGSVDEMKEQGAISIVDYPEELLKYIVNG